MPNSRPLRPLAPHPPLQSSQRLPLRPRRALRAAGSEPQERSSSGRRLLRRSTAAQEAAAPTSLRVPRRRRLPTRYLSPGVVFAEDAAGVALAVTLGGAGGAPAAAAAFGGDDPLPPRSSAGAGARRPLPPAQPDSDVDYEPQQQRLPSKKRFLRLNRPAPASAAAAAAPLADAPGGSEEDTDRLEVPSAAPESPTDTAAAWHLLGLAQRAPSAPAALSGAMDGCTQVREPRKPPVQRLSCSASSGCVGNPPHR